MSKKLNVCILGASKTGKSAIINMFINNYFDDCYIPTIENKSNKLFTFKNNKRNNLFNININDTAGLEEYNCLLQDSINNSECFIIVYSLTDRNSIDKIQIYKDMIKENYIGRNLPAIILVANKCDIEEDIVISKNEVLELSKVFQMPTIISSSVNLNSIISIFHLLIETVEQVQKQSLKNYSSYYKNWTLYDDIEFKKVHTTISFECNIIENDTRECKLNLNYYNDKLIAKSIDSCIQLENGDSQCGIILIEKVKPYPILENEIRPQTKGGLTTLVGKYLKLDTHYMLWSGVETDEITLLNIDSPVNKDIPINNIIIDIPPGCNNNETSLFLVVNWNFKKPIPIIYGSPKITDSIYNKNNNTITIIGDNFYNNIQHTLVKIDNSTINNSNIHSITHNEIIIKLDNHNFNNNIEKLPIIVKIGGVYSNKNEITTPKYEIKIIYNSNNSVTDELLEKPIIISNINLELSDFSRVNGKLVIDGKDFNEIDVKDNIEIKINGIGVCTDVQIINNNLLSGKLPIGISDGSIKEVSIFINKIQLQPNTPLTFSYNLPNIESVSSLSKNGGVITIHGINFYNPFKVKIDDQDCSTPNLEIRNENQSFLDQITCYIGPIHNDSIKSSTITITFNYNNQQHSIKTIKNYPKEEISNKGDFDKNKHLLEIIAPYSFTISMFIIFSLILLFLLIKRNSNFIPKILKNK